MSLIHQHEVVNVVPVDGHSLVPGGLCSHVEDGKSLGLIVAIEFASGGGTATVVWSHPPRGTVDMMEVRVQEINVTSRKLKTAWRVDNDDDIMKSSVVRTLLGLKA